MQKPLAGNPEEQAASPATMSFQDRVKPWLLECFGQEIASDRMERNHRFLEEALELVQACGATQAEAHQLVDYVYGRPVGEIRQEAGGVMVTLAALSQAQNIDMHQAGDDELARVWTKVDQIREKQKAKPAIGPLPGVYPDRKPAAVASNKAEGNKSAEESSQQNARRLRWVIRHAELESTPRGENYWVIKDLMFTGVGELDLGDMELEIIAAIDACTGGENENE